MTPPDDPRQAFEARRRARNIVLGAILVVLVLLFYGITIARMG